MTFSFQFITYIFINIPTFYAVFQFVNTDTYIQNPKYIEK